jgi:hypothetical protein
VATISIDAFGASGGDFQYPTLALFSGGLGGYISVCNIAASAFANKVLYVYVGGQGAQNRAAGLGGGGVGTPIISGQEPDGYMFASGGGASDVRLSINDLTTRYAFCLIPPTTALLILQ